MFQRINKIDYLSYTIIAIYLTLDLILYNVTNIGPDSGYYLGITRDWVWNSRIPTVDTYSIYTPIGYVFYSIPFLISHNPPIEYFLMLNLMLFGITTLIFLSIIKSFINDKSIVIIFLLSFLYAFNNITYDIKLENFILFLNVLNLRILTCFKFNVLKRNKTIIYIFLLGLISALSFLTKQFGGLTLIFSIIFFIGLNKPNKIFNMILLGSVFISIVLVYFSIQYLLGQDFEFILSQIRGELVMGCKSYNSSGGQIYGERKIINLLKGLKYYKYCFILFWFMLLIPSVYIKNQNKNNRFGLFIVLLILAQIPFYFQVFPHYQIFGLVFIFYYVLSVISKLHETSLSSGFFIQKYFILMLYGLIIIFTFFNQFKLFESNKKKSIEKKLFFSEINKFIEPKSKVFMLNNRNVWFACNFTTPVPKTLGYGFVSRNCFIQSIVVEQPLEFWLSDKYGSELTAIHGYDIIKRVSINVNNNLFKAAHYRKWQFKKSK